MKNLSSVSFKVVVKTNSVSLDTKVGILIGNVKELNWEGKSCQFETRYEVRMKNHMLGEHGIGDVWEAPADHLVEYGRVVLVPENVKGAADFGLAEVEKRVEVQVGEELLHQVRVEEELLLHTDLGVRGHLLVFSFYQLHVFLLVCSF